MISADLVERLAVRQRQVKEAGVGAVQRAEAIGARFDVEIGKEFAVDEQGIAEYFGQSRRPGIARDGII